MKAFRNSILTHATQNRRCYHPSVHPRRFSKKYENADFIDFPCDTMEKMIGKSRMTHSCPIGLVNDQILVNVCLPLMCKKIIP